MTLEQQVCSLGYAKRLKELGVKQESYFWWVILHPGSLVLPGPRWEVKDIQDFVHWKDKDYIAYSAFTVSELGEMLPEQTDIGFFRQEKDIGDNGEYWRVLYYDFEEPFFETEPVEGNPSVRQLKPVQEKISAIFEDESEADARAKMLIHLLENKLISLAGEEGK